MKLLRRGVVDQGADSADDLCASRANLDFSKSFLVGGGIPEHPG
jgi:hypothetical protein